MSSGQENGLGLLYNNSAQDQHGPLGPEVNVVNLKITRPQHCKARSLDDATHPIYTYSVKSHILMSHIHICC